LLPKTPKPRVCESILIEVLEQIELGLNRFDEQRIDEQALLKRLVGSAVYFYEFLFPLSLLDHFHSLKLKRLFSFLLPRNPRQQRLHAAHEALLFCLLRLLSFLSFPELLFSLVLQCLRQGRRFSLPFLPTLLQ